MEFEVVGEVFEWRGPAPFYFVAMPEECAREIDEVKQDLTYGWGMITCKIVLGFFFPATDATKLKAHLHPP